MAINKWKHCDGTEYVSYQLVKDALQADYNEFAIRLRVTTDPDLKIELFALGRYVHSLLKKLEYIKNSS